MMIETTGVVGGDEVMALTRSARWVPAEKRPNGVKDLTPATVRTELPATARAACDREGLGNGALASRNGSLTPATCTRRRNLPLGRRTC